ncbi:PRC-barrel domain-containing protein [Dactylosporangium vinaceum]|nr:PRC-barrel domain-containing protein [Dactylosporangium vinaceum]
MRAGELLGRPVTGADGRPLGRVADLVVEGDTIVAVIAVGRPRGGAGSGTNATSGPAPWLLEVLARWIMRRESIRIPWSEAAPSLLHRPG